MVCDESGDVSPRIIIRSVDIMENKKNNAKAFWIILAVLVSAVVALALIIRTEKRLLRFLGKAEKALRLDKKKNEPITVEI